MEGLREQGKESPSKRYKSDMEMSVWEMVMDDPRS